MSTHQELEVELSWHLECLGSSPAPVASIDWIREQLVGLLDAGEEHSNFKYLLSDTVPRTVNALFFGSFDTALAPSIIEILELTLDVFIRFPSRCPVDLKVLVKHILCSYSGRYTKQEGRRVVELPTFYAQGRPIKRSSLYSNRYFWPDDVEAVRKFCASDVGFYGTIASPPTLKGSGRVVDYDLKSNLYNFCYQDGRSLWVDLRKCRVLWDIDTEGKAPAPTELKDGTRIDVFWPNENRWFRGTVGNSSALDVQVLYDDGDIKT